MKPRLLYVVNAAYYFLSHRLPVALAAQSSGWEVHVASPASRETREIERAGLTVHPLHLSRWGTLPWQELRSIYALCRLYRRVNPQLVHHIAVKPVIYGGIAARIVTVPGVVNSVPGFGQVFTNRGVAAGCLRIIVKLLYRVALRHPNQCVIFQNPEDRDDFVRDGVVPERETRLIPGSGVDVERFQPSSFATSVPLIVLAARLLRQKGVEEFVEAARRVRSAGWKARFVLVGVPEPGNPGSVPESRLESWVHEGCIEWWGFRGDMPAVFASAHVACLPSFYHEGVPKALLEAAACGRPLVATDTRGCREIVRHGENGLLVPPRDAAALADAFFHLLQNRDALDRMGRASRAIATREFPLARVVRETLGVYEALRARIRGAEEREQTWSQ